MQRPSWDEYFMNIAREVAKRSTCMRRQVGAIAVDPESKRILATGYNGAVAGSKHCEELGCLRENVPSGERFELCRAVHAEENVICQAAKHGISLKGAWIYCTHKPCYMCLKKLVNAGVKRVIYVEDYPHDRLVNELVEQGLIELVKFNGKA